MNSDGHFKFPQAGRFNYGVLAASQVSLAAASFNRELRPSNSSIVHRCMSSSKMVVLMVLSPRYLPQP
jgi:hypothetical protein